MWISIKRYLPLIVSILITISLLYGVGFFLHRVDTLREQNEILAQQKYLVEQDLTRVNNKATSLEKLLSDKTFEGQQLQSIIANLRSKPADVRYIVKTQTKLIGTTVVETPMVDSSLTDEHYFKFDNGLVIAHSLLEPNQRKYDVYDLDFDAIVVIGEKDTGVLLYARSSFNPEEEVNLEVERIEVQRIAEHHRVFEPHLALGLTGSFSPTLDLSASIYIPLLHPIDNLDFLAPRASFSSKDIRVGADIISYNIGAPLPVLTDLWIGAGASWAFISKGISADITIGSKF